MIARHLLAALALLALPASAAPVSSVPPDAFAGLAFDQHPGAALPRDGVLRDADGRSVTTGSLFRENRPVVLVFDYFACRTLCGLVLGDLAAALAQVPLTPGRDYGVVAVSIDPRETPADAAALRARHFARNPELAAASRFLVGADGDADGVKRLADAVGFHYRYDPGLGQYAHPAGVVLVAPGGTVSRYILGIGYQPIDLRLGLVEASHGAIAAPASHLLLLCYGYDPANGRYDAAVGNLLRVTGTASVLALGGVVLLASRTTSKRTASKRGRR